MLKKNDNTYKNWIVELKSRIQQTQAKAAIQVNSALIELYWNLGKEIAESGFENTYGSGFFKQLSADLKKEFPDAKGYSVTNLKYFNRFYLFYKQEVENRQQLGDDFNNTIEQNRHQAGDDLENQSKQNRQQAVGDFKNQKFQQVVEDFPYNLF